MKPMLRFRISALFCIAVMLLATAAFAQSLNPTQDPPFIDISIPDYVADDRVKIEGKTETSTTVAVYLNNDLIRKKLFDDGDIEFEIEINANQKNIIVINAIKGNEVNRKTFEVVSDMVSPEIVLSAIPDVTVEKVIPLSGTLSEECTVDITVNGVNIFSDETSSFSIIASLEEGENSITISAVDKAGNSALLEKNSLSDTIPPKITDITPKTNSFYYQGRAVDDIAGITEPLSEVKLFYEYPGIVSDKTERVQIKKETSDANGFFEFKNINFENPKPGIVLREVEAGEIRTVQEMQRAQTVNMHVQATDRAGWQAEEKISYSIGTCWAGELDFDINSLLQYQYPTLLSPERLNEGTETISFVLEIKYSGNADSWQVRDLIVEDACGRSAGVLSEEYKNDPRYEISCGLLARLGRPSVVDHNRNKTLWYIQYKNLKTDSFINFTEDFWKAFRDRQLIFPFKITVNYAEKETVYETKADGAVISGEKMKEKVQIKCTSMGYFVDIPVDMRKILPDWLLDNGMDFANKTINEIDKIMPKIDQAITVAGASCITSWIGRMGIKIIRKVTCKWESVIGEAAGKKGEENYCPAEKERLALSKDALKKRCSACSSMWDLEAALYQAYRWSCDRIFCHTAPSGWTEKATGLQIAAAEVKSKFCGTEDVSFVKPLERVENCKKEYGSKLKDEIKNNIDVDTCYSYNGYLYVSLKPGVGDVYELDLAQKVVAGVVGAKIPPEKLKVKKTEGSNTFSTAASFASCDALCKHFNKKYVGNCMAPKECVAQPNGFTSGYVSGGKEECWVDRPGEQCCCYVKEEKTKEKEKPIADPKDWNYRDQQLNREYKGEYGKNFPKDVYISGRDMPACFGQEHLYDYFKPLNDKSIPVVDPMRQDCSAFQCLCLNSIKNRIMIIKSIMVGLKNCLKEIETTGRADAGVCKEVFSLYVCDSLYQLFVWAKEGCIPLPFTSGVRVHNQNADTEEPIPVIGSGLGIVFGGMNEVWDVVKNAGSDMEAEYGETALTNYLEGGEKALSRKVCLGALGFDVGLDFKSLTDLTYQMQYKTSVLGFGRRSFITYNPATSLGTYEYRGTWTLFTGCKVKGYTVDLTCVNMEEKSRYKGIDCARVNDVQHGEAPEGCNCLYSAENYAERSRKFYTSSSSVESGQFVEGDYHEVFAANKRYDHLKLTVNLDKGQDPAKCFPEGHEDGIFYFPVADRTAQDILDCYVDQRGWYKCTKGLEWEKMGDAWFNLFTEDACAGNKCYLLCKDPASGKYKSCDKVKYGIGDKIYIKTSIEGKKQQCFHAYAETAKGKRIAEKFYQIGNPGIDEDFTSEPTINVGTVTQSYFGEVGSGNLVLLNESSCHSQYSVRLEKGEQRQSGKASVVFKKQDGGFNVSVYGVKVYNNDDKEKIITDDLRGRTYTKGEIGKMLFILNGPAVKFTDISSGLCEFRAEPSLTAQKWKIYAELRYSDLDGRCDNAIDEISIVGKETHLFSNINVYEERPGKEDAAEEKKKWTEEELKAFEKLLSESEEETKKKFTEEELEAFEKMLRDAEEEPKEKWTEEELEIFEKMLEDAEERLRKETADKIVSLISKATSCESAIELLPGFFFDEDELKEMFSEINKVCEKTTEDIPKILTWFIYDLDIEPVSEVDEYEPFMINVITKDVTSDMTLHYFIKSEEKSYLGDLYKGAAGRYYYNFPDGRSSGEYNVEVWIETPDDDIELKTKKLTITDKLYEMP
ncbi:hypothetical protein KY317_03585 [Candidatus Woesearchaeota archaeon]|nr:hypothetical protein [Candidatus Woesearchaeota archaeon]